jgi:hypothetical protein
VVVTSEIDLVTLPSEEWRDMLAAAAVLDLVHGGYYRARPLAVLFYCGPDNAPEVWDSEFPDGSPEVPRSLVGQAEVAGPAGENEVTVQLTVTNWRAARAVKQAYERGEFRDRFQEYILAQEAALRGRPEHRAWLHRQFQRLRTHANGAVVGGG